MRARRVALAGALALGIMSRAAHGEPTNLHMRSGSMCKTDGGTELTLPPGYFVDEPTHDVVDAEVKRLQDAETRLTAENASFRKSAASWQPGWVTLASVLAGGIALGVYLDHKL